jgi:putative membrane protein
MVVSSSAPAPADLYAAFCGTPPDLFGQQLGGLLMLGIGTPIYLGGGLWLTALALRGADGEREAA